MKFAALALLSIATIMSAQTKPETAPAEVIFINASLYTPLPATEPALREAIGNFPRATQAAVMAEMAKGVKAPALHMKDAAIAVRDGRIVAIGEVADITHRFKGAQTEVVDLHGSFTMPGFNDAHVHLAAAGAEQLNVDLIGTTSLEDMLQRIAERVKTTPPGEWIVGDGWDHTKWTDRRLPTRQDLDAVTGNHPAIFGRVDGHIAVANSLALKIAGITRDTKDPQGAEIDHDAKGEPTGIIREDAAMQMVYSKIPPPSPEKRRKALELATADATQSGITSVQDFSTYDDFLVYEQMEREGKLTVRVAEWIPFIDPLKEELAYRAHHSANDLMLHTTMLKGFMDGSLGSRTAALLKPYSDDPTNSGLPRFDQAKLNQMAIEREAAGFQMGFHAIGDRAAQMALDAFAVAEASGLKRFRAEHPNLSPEQALREYQESRRFRIEHCQVITPQQPAEFAKLGVIASVQPNHLLTDMNWAESRIGSERAKYSYPWRSFLNAGVRLAFGTDFPVEPISPYPGVYAAVTRMNTAGTKSYYPEQSLTIDEALAAYTTGSAYAEFMEHQKGMLLPGMLADMVVLDRDLTRIPPAQILGTKVLRTVLGGKTVYEAK